MVYNVNGVVISMDDNIAPQFSESAAYSAGDYVLKLQTNGQNVLYKFTAAHAAGAWTGTDAKAVTMASELTDVKSQLNEKANVDGAYEQLTAGNAEQLVSTQGVEEQTPYLFRTTGGSADVGNRMELREIVGGTLAVNQYATNNASGWSRAAASALTISAESGEITLTSSTSSTVTTKKVKANTISAFANHVFFGAAQAKTDGVTTSATFALYDIGNSRLVTFVQGNTTSYVAGANICKPTSDDNYFALALPNATPTGNSAYFKDVMLVDLTAMFGSTIADYIYSLETATAGAGVAWLKQYFPQYFDAGYIPYNTGTLQSVSGLASHDEISADGTKRWSYPLDSSLTLRGIFGVDANGKPYVVAGDEYLPNGTVKRRMVQRTLNGSEAWTNQGSGNSAYFGLSIGSTGYAVDHSIISDRYVSASVTSSTTDSGVDVFDLSLLNACRIAIRPTNIANTTLDQFKATLAANPVTVVFELTAPTTETAEPYTKLQVCDPNGTEEFVVSESAGIIPPVGNQSFYMDDLVKRIEDAPNIPALTTPLTRTMVLDGTENWTIGTAYTNVQRFDLDGTYKAYTDAEHIRGVATVSKGVWTQDTGFSGITELSLCFNYGASPATKLYVLVPMSLNITTVDAFKSWLASENITIEYAVYGDYVLGATIQNGTATYAWVLKD